MRGHTKFNGVALFLYCSSVIPIIRDIDIDIVIFSYGPQIRTGKSLFCAYANHYSQTECSFASNIVTQCCNIDVQVYSEHISQTLLYKITGKFVPQACNICISNFQINSKRYLACELIGKRVCLQL